MQLHAISSDATHSVRSTPSFLQQHGHKSRLASRVTAAIRSYRSERILTHFHRSHHPFTWAYVMSGESGKKAAMKTRGIK